MDAAVANDDLFLSPAELVALTGATQPATQERIVKEEIGIVAYRNRNNEVRVAREALIRKQLGETPAKAKPAPRIRPIGGSNGSSA